MIGLSGMGIQRHGTGTSIPAMEKISSLVMSGRAENEKDVEDHTCQ
jgi:hypothetical protein